MKTLAQRVADLNVGETILVESKDTERARIAAYHRGAKMHIVHRNVGGLVLMQRVAESNYGKTKAAVAALEVGDSITVPAGKEDCFCNAAMRIGMHLSREHEPDGTVKLTRVATGLKTRCAQMMRAWRTGETVRVPTQARALSLCTSASRYGFRLSRRRTNDSQYLLTRVA